MGPFYVRDLSIDYGKNRILENVSFSAKAGEKISIVGPNGSGKSSLLKAIVGAVKLAHGEIQRGFESVGYVPQNFRLSDDQLLTTEEFLNLTKSNSLDADLEALLHLKDLKKEQIRNLSGGQFQRVLIAFALRKAPKLVLLDEFLDGLDLRFQEPVCHFLDHYAENHEAVVLEVTHDLNQVMQHNERVLLVNKTLLFDGSSQDPKCKELFTSLYPHHFGCDHG